MNFGSPMTTVPNATVPGVRVSAGAATPLPETLAVAVTVPAVAVSVAVFVAMAVGANATWTWHVCDCARTSVHVEPETTKAASEDVTDTGAVVVPPEFVTV